MRAQPLVKHPYQADIRWAFWRWADIQDQYDPARVYLRRLRVIQTPLFAVYLHWIYVPDSDRDPHNHPMNFWSFILRGGYFEDRWYSNGASAGSRVRKRWSLARTRMDDFHRITALRGSPVVTLLLVGKRSKSWGFLTDGGFVDKTDYFAGVR